ncbi:phosphoglycerate kinase [Candidatus Protochlamydia phocaeensis]|uniref:phosphoglycerate kinase n=1 Tax=Candidatus Protochlamydia phocaeensis TaxID=1414722 RepID=UPI0008395920|nr:phosphoglycerate kinase [Candidatus Protochlamydia phocaeensis]
MAQKLSIKDLDLAGKKVLIRVDFNVPLENGTITDDTRIRASLPTIQYVLNQGGSAILMSHLGRPKGKPDPQFSLAPCAKRLSELLKRPVQMAPDCCGPTVEKMAHDLQPGDVLLLENLRFHKGEEKPEEEPTFASALSELGEVYVNDAFGSAHRAHASTTTIAQFFPGRAAAGFLMEKEIAYLGSTLLNPRRPFCAVLGGAKISTKFKVIEAFIQKADVLLIGGAMAYTFFKSENIPIGDSLYEEDFINVARELLEVDTQSRCRILLPTDVVIARQIDPQAETRIVRVQEGIPEGYQGVDIGPETIQRYISELNKAATIFWNGPLGIFECPPFAKGTQEIAKAMANLSATTIVGGGDSVAAVEQAGVADRMSHISTGGGASLEYIEFGKLPGVEALTDKQATAKTTK